MSTNNNEQALDLKALLSSGKYIIPIYQRNYAWGKAEISQLIRDINEFFENNAVKNYYIGSLVCFKRENGDYELIDGQQRHTTISLINAILKSECKNDKAISSTNLKFDSRKNAQQFLEELHNASKLNDYLENTSILGVQNFKDAIEFIREEMQGKDFRLVEFSNNFYNKVKFFRVEVPQDTDLNHYFEILNNRGEQLEKHEIVKANLMAKINKKEQETFAVIWNACSDMNNYVYFNFDGNNQKTLFDNDGKVKVEIDGFSKISISENTDNIEGIKLSDIIKENALPENFPKEENTPKEKYKSVIDFPNFLLQVLKIDNNDVSLDDKKLLEQFRNLKIDPKVFVFNLLKYRTLFDTYIIKQDLSDADESKQNWGIRTLKSYNKYLTKTFDEDEELVNLQTMLYYSNPSNTNNNWLQEILKNVFYTQDNYTNNIFEIAKSRFAKENLSYPNITIFNLYFIDYLLWKLYKQEDKIDENLRNLKANIDKSKSHFNGFKFKQLNSKEHLFPQTKAIDFNISHEDLNGIGNLCLISTSQNSRGNKDLPSAKKKSFEKDNSSLKRLIMFENFVNDKWETNEIKIHEQEIRTLVNQFTD